MEDEPPRSIANEVTAFFTIIYVLIFLSIIGYAIYKRMEENKQKEKEKPSTSMTGVITTEEIRTRWTPPRQEQSVSPQF